MFAREGGVIRFSLASVRLEYGAVAPRGINTRKNRIMSFRDAMHAAKVNEAGDGRVREERPTADGSIAKTLVGRNQG